mgnify:CR=1 FL=1
MRLANGIVIDKEATFGALKFSALRREVHLQNEDGSVSEEIKERTYDLKIQRTGAYDSGFHPCQRAVKGVRLQRRGGTYQSGGRHRGNGYFSRGRGGLVHQGGGYCPEKRGCHESAAAEERRSPCKITGT